MRFVSIIGDSISTYEGFNPDGYAVFYDRERQIRNNLSSVYDTWWAKVNQALHAYICVNNSYSGSMVSGFGFPAASSEARTGRLHTSRFFPDIILIYIGFNDYGYGVPVRAEGNWGHTIPNWNCFEDAYSQMLSNIKRCYPYATIVCGTLMRTCIAGNDSWSFPENFAGHAFEEYNQAIRRVCKKENCFLADVAAEYPYYETLDGSHPTKNGHITLSKAWISSLSGLGIL